MYKILFIILLIILIIICVSFNKIEYLSMSDNFTDEILNNIGANEYIDKFKDKNVTIQTYPTNEYLSYDINNTLQSSYVNNKPTIYKLTEEEGDYFIKTDTEVSYYLTMDIDAKVNLSFDKNDTCKTEDGKFILCDNKWKLLTFNNKVLFKQFLKKELTKIPQIIINKIKVQKSKLPNELEETALFQLNGYNKEIYENVNNIEDLCKQELSFINSEVIRTYLKIELNKLCKKFNNLNKNTYFIQNIKFSLFLRKNGSVVEGTSQPTMNDLWRIIHV